MGAGRRHELTDAAWAVIEPLLPFQPRRRGHLWADHRRVINRIIWILAAGAVYPNSTRHFRKRSLTSQRRVVGWKNIGGRRMAVASLRRSSSGNS